MARRNIQRQRDIATWLQAGGANSRNCIGQHCLGVGEWRRQPALIGGQRAHAVFRVR